MKTYVRRGLDLVLKSTDSSGGIPGNLSVQLTGVVNSPEILPNSSGKILIPTNQIYSTRGLRGVVALTNNSAGNYKLAAFNCRDACAVTIDVKCGGIVNYRWDLAFNKNPLPSNPSKPGDGKLFRGTALVSIYDGFKYDSVLYQVNWLGATIATKVNSNYCEVWLMRLPQYHVGFAEISISGDEVYDSVLFNNPTPDSPYMGTDWSTMNVDGFISAAGVVPIGVTKVMKTTLM